MKCQATKMHKVIERDAGNIAECIGDVRKWCWFMLSVDATQLQRDMDKLDCQYYNFWRNPKR